MPFQTPALQCGRKFARSLCRVLILAALGSAVVAAYSATSAQAQRTLAEPNEIGERAGYFFGLAAFASVLADQCRDAPMTVVTENGLTLAWRGAADRLWAHEWARGYAEAAEDHVAALVEAGWMTPAEARDAPNASFGPRGRDGFVQGLREGIAGAARTGNLGLACAMFRYTLNDNHRPITTPRVRRRQ